MKFLNLLLLLAGVLGTVWANDPPPPPGQTYFHTNNNNVPQPGQNNLNSGNPYPQPGLNNYNTGSSIPQPGQTNFNNNAYPQPGQPNYNTGSTIPQPGQTNFNNGYPQPGQPNYNSGSTIPQPGQTNFNPGNPYPQPGQPNYNTGNTNTGQTNDPYPQPGLGSSRGKRQAPPSPGQNSFNNNNNNRQVPQPGQDNFNTGSSLPQPGQNTFGSNKQQQQPQQSPFLNRKRRTLNPALMASGQLRVSDAHIMDHPALVTARYNGMFTQPVWKCEITKGCFFKNTREFVPFRVRREYEQANDTMVLDIAKAAQAYQKLIRPNPRFRYNAARLESKSYFPARYADACLAFSYMWSGVGMKEMAVLQRNEDDICIYHDLSENGQGTGVWKDIELPLDLKYGDAKFIIDFQFDLGTAHNRHYSQMGEIAIRNFTIGYGQCYHPHRAVECDSPMF